MTSSFSQVGQRIDALRTRGHHQPGQKRRRPIDAMVEKLHLAFGENTLAINQRPRSLEERMELVREQTNVLRELTDQQRL